MYIKFQLKYFLLLIFFIRTDITFAQTESQTLPFQKLSTDDISQFEIIKSNFWHIAGNVNTERKVAGNSETKTGKGILIYSPDKTDYKPFISDEGNNAGKVDSNH